MKQGEYVQVQRKYIKELILDLANVNVWKYNLVTVAEYKRKIHNSYYFINPYFLLYWISLCQYEKSILEEGDGKILQRVVDDGYQNRKQLSSISLSLISMASGCRKMTDPEVFLQEVYHHFKQKQDFEETDIYFNYPQFGNKILGSRLLDGVICLENIRTAGCFGWKEFLKENKDPIKEKTSEEIVYVKRLDVNRRNIRMTMKKQCMAPVLEEGDEIEVSFDASIQIGDILVFRHYSGIMMAHRVLDIIYHENNKNVYITGADNGSLWEYPVFQKDVVGKVTAINRRRREDVEAQTMLQ